MLPKTLVPLLPYIKRYRWGYITGSLCVLLTNGIWCYSARAGARLRRPEPRVYPAHKLLIYAAFC